MRRPLCRLAPHAAPDAFTLALLVLSVAAMLLWRAGPLSVISGGAIAGVIAGLKPFKRLKDLS